MAYKNMTRIEKVQVAMVKPFISDKETPINVKSSYSDDMTKIYAEGQCKVCKGHVSDINTHCPHCNNILDWSNYL